MVKVGKTAAAAGAPAEDQYVELAREKTDKIFVVLAEFGNDARIRATRTRTRRRRSPGRRGATGPLHNEIPAPNRAVDNTTIWQPDYNRAHYEQMYFGTGAGVESVKTYYERQSSGRYSVDGQVTDWVKVRYNEARYGRSNGFPCAGNVCSNTWDLIRDAIDAWVADQKADGKTDEQIKADLASYDAWDRNDFDHDGNFNEADGYIDHFQIVHSGGDQADGDPFQGEDAIWSHRWKAYQGTGQGPANNKDGGTQIGTTGLWIADYTIQPENGGISVFAHEYGHDLGLPDHYDTAGGGGQRRQLVDADGPEPRVRAGGSGHRHARRGPRRVGQAAARLARLRDRRRRARTARSTSARTSTTARRRRASSWCCPRRRSSHQLGAPRRAPSSGGRAAATTTTRR